MFIARGLYFVNRIKRERRAPSLPKTLSLSRTDLTPLMASELLFLGTSPARDSFIHKKLFGGKETKALSHRPMTATTLIDAAIIGYMVTVRLLANLSFLFHWLVSKIIYRVEISVEVSQVSVIS